MTDERIRQIAAEGCYMMPGDGNPEEPLRRMIRQALTERDAEIAEWVRDNTWEVVVDWSARVRSLPVVESPKLLAFLKGAEVDGANTR